MQDFSSTLGLLRKSSVDFRNPFSRCKVKVNIGSSKLIWGHGGRFDGEEVSSPFSWGYQTWYSRDLKLIKLTFKSTASLVRRTISYGSSPLFEGEKSDLK